MTEAPLPPVFVVNGPGVLSEEPVIVQTAAPSVELPVSQKRRLAESAVLFVSAILLLRTIAIEPFGVPTGSMAPTLYGNHRALPCPRCGYPIKIGEQSNRSNGPPRSHCTNCDYADFSLANASDIAGDRLLVDKNVFRLRSPRRWEVAVFICPSDQSKPYVKRIVGLPGESVLLQDGDVWIDGQLSRKTLSQVRECKIPVFDSNYSPPAGWARRWYPEGIAPPLNADEPPKLPDWMTLERDRLMVNALASTTPRLGVYWHVAHDTGVPEVLRDGFEYNGHGTPNHHNPIHDLLLTCLVEVESGEGIVVLQLTDGAEAATVHLGAGGDFGESKLLIGSTLARTANRKPLQVGQSHRVELAFVDRRVSLAVDGQLYFDHDLPSGVRREDLVSPFRLGGRGVQVRFSSIELERDIYYRPGERIASQSPHTLGPDEFFLLGDNSANSDDSRSWRIPGVPERNFLGKPILLHQPNRPGQLTVGGRTLNSQSIDWSRIRWIR